MIYKPIEIQPPGLRKVYPYYFTFTTFTKGRWVGEKILDVFAREFRAHPVEEYVSIQLGPSTLMLDGILVAGAVYLGRNPDGEL